MTSVGEMFYVYLLLLFGVLGQEPIVKSSLLLDDISNGNCSCGGFPTPTPEENSEPLLAQTPPLLVKCNDEGASTCKSLCLALASATKAKGPEILCARLKDVNELKMSPYVLTVDEGRGYFLCDNDVHEAFYKICERPWSYADMTAEEPLCCENSKAYVCSSVEGTTVAPSI